MKRVAKVLFTIVLITVAVAVLSYMTTSANWEGGFPAGEFRIHVSDANGQPISGAKLMVYRAGRQLADGYPIDNHTKDSDLISDESGQIVGLRVSGGLQFGGQRWKLFWFIPMGKQTGPQYDCEITAEGYQPAKFEVRRLFESPYTMYDDFPKTERVIGGKEKELLIFDHTFTLSR